MKYCLYGVSLTSLEKVYKIGIEISLSSLYLQQHPRVVRSHKHLHSSHLHWAVDIVQ